MKTWTLGLTDNHDKSALLPLVRMDNACWAQFYGVDKGENAKLAAAAPAMQAQLKRIEGWLFVSLLHPDAPLNRENAGKMYHEIEALLQTLKG